MIYSTYLTPPLNYPQKKVTVDELFSPTPKYLKIETKDALQNLEKGDVVYTTENVQFYAEKPIPYGTKLTFTRYMYSDGMLYPSRVSKQYAFFRFPDGSERSLRKEQVSQSRIRIAVNKLLRRKK